MPWLTDEQTVSAARERAEKALRIPLGMASPLWLAFGAAASVGVTWWWMTRWTKAVNLEAMTPFKPLASALEVVEPSPAPEVVAEPNPEPAAPAIVAKAPPAPKPAPVIPAEPADLTRLVGIGPKLADALAARGVTQFSHIAAWTADDLAKVDTELKLLGRAARDAWVAQAKRFAGELN